MMKPQKRTDKYGPRRIAVLTAHGIASQGITEALSYMFPHAECAKIKPGHLRPQGLEQYDVLVLPGTYGEDSVYPDVLTPQKADYLRQAVEQGLVLITFCAATYYMCNRIQYTKRSGERKDINGCGLIAGTAKQAFAHITRNSVGTPERADFILAKLSLQDQWTIHALNINGPEISLDEQERRTCTPFMTYAATGGTAAVQKKIGKGLILAMGVHPELTTNHPLLPPHFSRHDDERWQILDHLADTITNHKDWGTVPQRRPSTPSSLEWVSHAAL